MVRRKTRRVDKDIDDILKEVLREATPFLKELNKFMENASRIYDGEKKKYDESHKVKMMEVEEAAKILGVKSDATPEEVKAAFRKMAKKYHPDISKDPTAPEKFMKVRAAYEVMVNAGAGTETTED
jgi:ribosomal protein L14E/L6E/L27E